MILLKNISYKTASGILILDNINLEIKRGEFVVITGKSGSGKSTLGSVINGLIAHYYDGTLTGEAYLNGKDINSLELPQIGRMAGSVFQDPRSQFFMTDPFSEAAFGCSNMFLSREEILKRVDKTLELFGISHLKERNIFKLSSGEKQKLAIASCYAMSPEIYLFDEPTANLDIHSIFDLEKILRSLKEEGKTIIILEHRLFYLSSLCERMLVMDKGKITGEYSKAEFFQLQKNKNIRNIYLENIEPANCKNLIKKNSPLFEIKNISYSHSKQEKFDVLKDINIKAYKKEIIGIIGENGAGKTSLAKLCTGLLKEKDGSILIEEKKQSYKKRLGSIYFVMQDSDFQLFGNTVKDELDIGKKEGLSDAKKESVLSDFEILDLKERHPLALSRGQKQRLTIAAAFCTDCKIIFLDEPTSGLDKHSMDLVSKTVLTAAKSGKLIFVISHDYEFLMSVCSRIIYLKSGRLQSDFNLDDAGKTKLWELLNKGRLIKKEM
ncbi:MULTISPECIES: ABC transporter ATP-binding protein [unclassified Treponema]|uniref:ABC transporter ATP-binding protein n=1 Tax=unclassified Treponema TaxID=2638727 RepID=UPI0020A3FE64|nr:MULTISPECIES: energy-coupling factor ABC transporter ATP-binding protein [unclassified Treponema]UTC66825.1 energy-coupling factor ABC transporter ATP-binding protein [Treponema sp. OMZ 789]UTC69557.1 energy-coupling factor ABC transporter ATP-binding protein [Treponema sp. OMZ 790]UTC72270.1 energy-coupling factor ABC transporter ATP-binding protein [Treponema sp. OMZ 791]